MQPPNVRLDSGLFNHHDFRSLNTQDKLIVVYILCCFELNDCDGVRFKPGECADDLRILHDDVLVAIDTICSVMDWHWDKDLRSIEFTRKVGIDG